VKLRYADFAIVTRDVTVDRPTRDAAAIRDAVRQCLRRVTFDRRLRLLGVRVGTLVREADAQPQAVMASESLPLFG
jgi:DNA polymerase-4